MTKIEAMTPERAPEPVEWKDVRPASPSLFVRGQTTVPHSVMVSQIAAATAAMREECARTVAALKKPMGTGYNQGIADAVEAIRALASGAGDAG